MNVPGYKRLEIGWKQFAVSESHCGRAIHADDAGYEDLDVDLKRKAAYRTPGTPR